MKKTKLQWQMPDYYPLEQAIVKSGSFYDGRPEGSIQYFSSGNQIQYTGGFNSFLDCGIVQTYTIAANVSTSFAGDICEAPLNLDLSVNYCSVCL